MSLVIKDDAEILGKGLLIKLEAAPAAAAAAPTPRRSSGGVSVPEPVPLTELIEELQAEAGDQTSAEAVAARWSDVGARRSLFDRALVGRLSATTDTPVIDYLVGCFARVADLKARKSSQQGALAQGGVGELLDYVSELCVSYSAIALANPTMFPQPAEAEAEGVVRLLRHLRANSLPASFLSRLVAKFGEDDNLADLGLPLFSKLAEEASKSSLLGADPYGPYHALLALVRERPLGTLLCTDPSFIPLLCRNGSLLQTLARLGPFFGLSCFPAELKIAQECFPDASNPHSAEQSLSTLRNGLKLVQDALTAISKDLLKNPDAKEPFFKFVAACCALNGARSQQYFPHAEGQRLLHAIAPQHVEPPQTLRSYSHDGMLLNLGVVLLNLCDPFTAPNSPHAAKIDPSFLLSTHRLDLKEETRLCATADDVMRWLDPRNPDLRQRYLDRMAAEGIVEVDPEGVPPLEVSASFGTISEYFFLTMRVLHVGLLSSFTMLEQLMKDHQKHSQAQQGREQELMQLRASGADPVHAMRLEQEIAAVKKWIEGMKQCILCYQTQLGDQAMLSLAMRYYRLVARWLVATAQPPPEGLPLPETVPRVFAALPEYVMSDVADFLKHLIHLAPQALEQVAPAELEDFVTMMVTFIGAPKYVKNPYLRATFTKLLCYLIPKQEDETGRRHAPERLAGVLHMHPLAQKHLAPAVMQVG
jgi:ubiquitin conjugation factor E4 B